MMKFCQPNDHYHKGRNIWFDPYEVALISTEDHTNIGECVITLKNGKAFTVAMSKDDAAKAINESINEPFSQ